RRLLDRSPGATVLLFGDEDPRTAAALVAAGVRGVIRGGERDPVAGVAKALLLIGSHRRGGVEPVPAGRPSAVRTAGPGGRAAAAGVRGVLRGGERDPVAAVAKALLLIGSHRRGGGEPVPAGRPSPVRPAAPGRQAAAPAGDGRAVPVPAQRGDGVAEETPVA